MFNPLSKIKRIVVCVLVAVFLSAAVLVSGCATDSVSWVLKTIRENYYFYDEMDKEGLEDLSIDEIVKRLDIYSAYYTAEEYEAILKDYSGEKAGVGFSYSYVEAGESSVYPQGGCVIALVMGNSPAEKSGMRAGQLLTSGTLDGDTTEFNRAGALEEFITPIEAGVEFTLTDSSGNDYNVFKSEYAASYTFMATATSAYTPAVNAGGNVTGVKEDASRAIDYLPEGFAYVSLLQFFGKAGDEFGCLMEKFNALGCTSLILDLRSNGGGYVDVMCDIAGYFTSSLGSGSHVAMTAEYRNGYIEVYESKPHTGKGLVPADTTVYLLANSGTASASEALTGVLVDYGYLEFKNIFLSDYSEEFLSWAGEGVGTKRSYGKGIMQSPFMNYWTHEVLKLTTAQIFWPGGKSIHLVGLTPADGCRTVPCDWVVTPDDSELKRVIDMITA